MRFSKKKTLRFIKQLPRRLGWPTAVRWYNQGRYLFRKPYIKLESAMAIEGCGVFVCGWVLGPPSAIDKISLSLAGQAEFDITDQLLWQQDDNLSKRFGMYKYRLRPRFIGLIELPESSYHNSAENSGCGKSATATLRFYRPNGRSQLKRLALVDTREQPLAAIEALLGPIPMHAEDKRQWFDQVYGPAVHAIWASKTPPDRSAEKVVYNPQLASASPQVSLVIPIYGRYDFIEYQLSEFVNDPDMYNHEIVYVIDDPGLAAEIRQSAQVLERIYKISFSIVYLGSNLGFAGASNQGAQLAIASRLLMMNSDVMPASRGWLSTLIDSAGEDINHSITGVRLLFEDDAIQHNGMSFFASPFVNDLWTNIHPSKGLSSDLVAANDARFDCEAVTGACLLMTTDNFLALGGFDESYILGDYEDSDLCMKARKKGLRIVMDDKVVLYHLERQSQSLVSTNRWKDQLTYYNCWQHTNKWDADIRRLKNHTNASEAVSHG